MKTIWHWKNIFKSVCLCLLAAIAWGFICYFIDINDSLGIIIGFLVGVVSMQFALSKWDCWHFEW